MRPKGKWTCCFFILLMLNVDPAVAAGAKVLLDVPVVAQKPELKNGCEVTSLAMLLNYAGIKVSKMELASRVKKDTDPLRLSGHGDDVSAWGNPNHGFVGDITGKTRGYAVYDRPLEHLMRLYLGGRVVNLTGYSFAALLARVEHGQPVLVWTTCHFQPPRKWDVWVHGEEEIRGTREEHAVLLVGYDDRFVYINDPLTAGKAQPIDRKSFEASWVALGKMALSYR